MKHYVHYAFTGTSVYSGTKESDTDAEFDSFEEAKASAIESIETYISKATANLNRLKHAKSVQEYENSD